MGTSANYSGITGGPLLSYPTVRSRLAGVSDPARNTLTTPINTDIIFGAVNTVVVTNPSGVLSMVADVFIEGASISQLDVVPWSHISSRLSIAINGGPFADVSPTWQDAHGNFTSQPGNAAFDIAASPVFLTFVVLPSGTLTVAVRRVLRRFTAAGADSTIECEGLCTMITTRPALI